MSLFAEATAIAEAVRRDPEDALQAANSFIERHRGAAANSAAMAEAHRARGTARRAARDLEGALEDFSTGIRIAEASGHFGVVGRILTSRSVVFLEKSQPTLAFDDLDNADHHVEDDYRGIFLVQRGTVHARLNPEHDPMPDWDAAIPLLEEHGQLLYLADVYRNSGIFLGYRGNLTESTRRIRAALNLYEQIGADMEAAVSYHSLAWAESLQGDLTRALQYFEIARRRLDYGSQASLHLAVDYANTLLSVGIADEAQKISADAASRLAGHDSTFEAGRAYLSAGVAALHAGADHLAAQFAAQASDAFSGSGAGTWQSLAQYLELRALARDGDDAAALLVSARVIVERLDTWGWTSNAQHARLFAVDLCTRLGRLDEARSLIGPMERDATTTLEVRVHLCLTVALLLEAEQDFGGAMRACHRGIDLLSRYRDSLGSIDLRCHLMSFADDLRSRGLRLALRAGRADRVLSWNEKCTATALLSPPLTPTDDPELKTHLAELRRIGTALESRAPDQTDLAPGQARQSELRDLIRRRARTVEARGLRRQRPSIAELKKKLHGHTLIELIVSNNELHGLVMQSGTVRLTAGLCGLAEIAPHMTSARHAIAELFNARPSRTAAAIQQLHAAAAAIDQLLIEPLVVAEHKIVLVPPAALGDVPWSLLPGLHARALTISPSAASWYFASTRNRPDGGTVAIAGTDLGHANAEVRMVGDHRDPSVVLTTRDSQVARVLGLLETSSTAHFASHCRLRTGNPLFSQLDLADGPLFAYDLLGLKRTPHLVILSACESGRDEATGNELLGLTAALLARETSSVIASKFPLPDTPQTVEALRIVHRDLAQGAGPSQAIATMVAALDLSDARQLLVAAALSCYGAS